MPAACAASVDEQARHMGPSTTSSLRSTGEFRRNPVLRDDGLRGVARRECSLSTTDESQVRLADGRLLWDRAGWARVTDVAKRRRQGLVVCRAAVPFEGLCDARPGVAL